MLNPKTGAVYVMASSPTYNPNQIESPNGYAQHHPRAGRLPRLVGAAAEPRDARGSTRPGSTFKTVTAAAALDSGKSTPPTRASTTRATATEYGQQVYNAGNPDQNGPESYGNVDFVQAFEHSINAVFCNIGKTLGAKRVLDEAKKFGFYSKPPIELPSNEVAASGLYNLKTHALYDNAGDRRPGPPRVRPGAPARDAAADGDRRRRRRERRHGDGAAPRQEGDLAERQASSSR